MHRRTRVLLAASGLAALVAVALIARVGRGTPASPPVPTAPAAPDAVLARAAGALAPAFTGLAASAGPPAVLPRSLDGTDPDGDVTADAAGHLVIDLELRRLFDHFLAATGEEPLAAIRGRILAVLRARLPAGAAAEAAALLDQYLAYREAARQLAVLADPATGLAQIHDLRARMFAPDVVRAFFADEEAAIYAALARRAAIADPTLSGAERARRVAEIDARQPPAARAARAAATAPIDELGREQAMRAAGASDDQINAARTAALDAGAASRLAELDRAHAAWDARLAVFRAERAQLLADPALDDAERARRIDDLLERSFTEPERIRVQAIERIAAHAAHAH